MRLFAGQAVPLSAADIADVAASINCDPATFQAVMAVESGGSGFLPDGSGRPVILFEAAVFSRRTGGRFDATHPGLSRSAADWHQYRGGAAEYERLAAAAELDRKAALQATSWGLFQILGENAELCGFGDVEGFVLAMAFAEKAQLMAFAKFIQATGAAPALKAHNWAEFARRYNGPLYAKNAYDTRLAAAYAHAFGAGSVELRLGATGARVVALQTALNGRGYQVEVDGIYGHVTMLAVRRFQEANGLSPDGIVGAATASALSLRPLQLSKES